MSSKIINTHHKTRIENCKGTLKEHRENYVKWAYWCPVVKSGWTSKPCECANPTNRH